MKYKIKSVVALPNYLLDITFTNNEKRLYNVALLMLKYPMFNSLLNVNGLFQQATVDTAGLGISWNEDIDISADELYNNGVKYA